MSRFGFGSNSSSSSNKSKRHYWDDDNDNNDDDRVDDNVAPTKRARRGDRDHDDNNNNNNSSSNNRNNNNNISFEQELTAYRKHSINAINGRFQALFRRQHQQLRNNKNNDAVDGTARIPNELERLSAVCLREIADVDRMYGTMYVGRVIVWGSNENDGLCLVDPALNTDDVDDNVEREMIKPPMYHPILTSSKLRYIAAGGATSAAVDIHGHVYTWGIPDDGALGRPGNDLRIPVQFPSEQGRMIQVALGESFGLALSVSGNVYFWGMYRDSVKQEKFCHPKRLPDGSFLGKPFGFCETPVLIPMPGKVMRLAPGGSANFSAAILEDKSLVTWGFGNSGELGRSEDMTKRNDKGEYDLGEKLYYTVPEVTINKDGSKYVEDKPDPQLVMEHFLTPKAPRWAGPVPFPKRHVLSVACGSTHLLVAACGSESSTPFLYSTGRNLYGQLGLGDTEERHMLTRVTTVEDISQVAAGMYHSLALSTDGRCLYAFGGGDSGQLGIGELPLKKYVETPTRVRFPQNPLYAIPVTIKNIACGDTVSLAITMDHNLYTWGFGEMGATAHKFNRIHEPDGDVKRPTRVTCLPGQPGMVAVAGGGQHSVLLTDARFE